MHPDRINKIRAIAEAEIEHKSVNIHTYATMRLMCELADAALEQHRNVETDQSAEWVRVDDIRKQLCEALRRPESPRDRLDALLQVVAWYRNQVQ